MSVLIVLLILCIWGALLYNFGYYASFAVKRKWVRQVIGAAVTLGLFTLPLNDEIAGAKEFEALCNSGGAYQIAPSAFEKKFDLKSNYSENKKLSGYSQPVEEIAIVFSDIATGNEIATAKAYVAKGGWLVQRGWLKNSGGGDGAFLGRPQCFPSETEGNRLSAVVNKFVK